MGAFLVQKNDQHRSLERVGLSSELCEEQRDVLAMDELVVAVWHETSPSS
jgi:hypothetical protein